MTKSLPYVEQRFIDQHKGYDRRIKALEHRQQVVLPDNSVPGTPSFFTPLTAFYQSTSDGTTKAEITLSWTTPTNTDGSTVVDAAYYEIQYRPSTNFTNQPTHAQIAALGLTHAQLNSGGYTHITMPGAPALSSSDADWHPIIVPWNNGNTKTIKELTPGVSYDFRIRFADTATPTNLSAWSTTTTVVAAADSLAPSQPAAPSVASSLIAVQVTHTLGKFSGGTYNLESDLHHLEVHASYEPTFTPTSATLLGKLIANVGMITANIPALGSFGVSSTAGVYVKVIAVDISGNKSVPSLAASATATLIDSQHISDLSADKITAGTITSQILLAGSIKTSTVGARAEIDAAGVRLYDASNNNTVNLSAADGSAVVTGTVRTNLAGAFSPSITMNPQFVSPGTGAYPTIVMADGFNGGSGVFGPARLNATAYGAGGSAGTQTGLNSGPSATGAAFKQSTALMRPDGFVIKFNDQDGNKRGGFASGDALGGHLGVTDSSGNQMSALDVASDGSFIINNNVANKGFQYDSSGNMFASSAVFSWAIGTTASIYNDGNDVFFLNGKWPNFVSATSASALFTGQNALTGAAIAISYGATLNSGMVPVATMQNGSGGSFCTITANSTTGFTITANVSAAQNFNYWAYRV